MITGLLLTLAALAIVDSTSFGTLGIPVYLMVASERGQVPRLLLYLATVAVFYYLVGVGLMLGLSTAMENFGDALHSEAAYWVQLVLGVGLFALSFRFDGKRGKGPRLEPRMGGPRAMVLLGLTAGTLEVATMVPYLAAIGIMTTAALPAGQWLPLLAAYVALMFVPVLALLGLRATAAAWVEPKLVRLRAWLARHAASAVGWTLGIAGFLLARDAAAFLFFSGG
ncbi:GAP family protein [Nonomuraea harbinensis]|uniref:GAP family protein n=1 Tax=Nonomuraea harbinensis TaxID=1286938 RepID=A0ABW1BML2_9ACTN|nr:GAP family protein [Nonomuraea harbinensis]